MTLPFEEQRSLHMARKFLRGLLDPKQTPRIPRDIRNQAYSVLRHFPGDYRVDELYDLAKRIELKMYKDANSVSIRYDAE